MSGPSRIVFRAARAMISDRVMISGLALALLGDAFLWRESAHWSRPLGLPGDASSCHGDHCGSRRVMSVIR